MKININSLKYSIIFLILIEPKIFTQYKITAYLYALLNVVLFIFYLINIKRGKVSMPKPLIFWIIFRIYILLIMILNNTLGDIDQWGYLSLMVTNSFFTIDYAIKKQEFKLMVRGATITCILLLFLNMLSMFFFPNGIIPSLNIYDNGDGDFHFLGIKVSITTYVYPAMALGILNRVMGEKKKFILILTLSIFNILYSNVSTGIVALIIIAISFLLFRFMKKNIKIIHSLIISLIANIFVVFLGAQRYFSNFIVNVLHKSVSLTGRVDIWNVAVEIIKNQNFLRLIFGNGIFNNGAFVYIGHTYWAAHNLWLQYLYQFGIVGMIIFIVFIISFGKNKSSNNTVFSVSNCLISCICFAILVTTMTTTNLEYAHVYIPFILLYFCRTGRIGNYE